MPQNKQISWTHIKCDVTRCVMCISKKVEYLDKEQSYKNSTKQVLFLIQLFFPMQSKTYWTKFRVITSFKFVDTPHNFVVEYNQAESCKKFSRLFTFQTSISKIITPVSPMKLNRFKHATLIIRFML